jgi:hypothetical protein
MTRFQRAIPASTRARQPDPEARRQSMRPLPVRSVRGSAFHAAIASGVNHTVRLPRARRPASYSA